MSGVPGSPTTEELARGFVESKRRLDAAREAVDATRAGKEYTAAYREHAMAEQALYSRLQEVPRDERVIVDGMEVWLGAGGIRCRKESTPA